MSGRHEWTELPASLAAVIAAVRPADTAAVAQARARQDTLTKPRGALGALEDVSVRLAGIAGVCPPPVPGAPAVAVFAADHGVHAQGVTPWPQEVTAQMVANFAAGGAAVNAFAAQLGARVVVVDVGVASPVEPAPALWSHRIRPGTRDLTVEPAMTRAEALAAVGAGVEVAQRLVDESADVLLTGDMGIANTTASAALVAAFTGASPDEVTGRGTGVDDATLGRKIDAVRRALDRSGLTPSNAAADPVGALAAVGGLEHAALAGFVLAGSARRVPVILDGVIAGAAALVAHALAPASIDACLAGHRSAEPGHAHALRALGLRPLVELDLRLGEGTGAVLALPLVQAAAAALRDMATFDAAGVVDKTDQQGTRGRQDPQAGSA
ncbi:MAG: nicotinate-nucleotide--dimethylbenzimidazole phosphoribosyltransferase [Kineosporiaceae bacterium]